jgi:hypothetical protein
MIDITTLKTHRGAESLGSARDPFLEAARTLLIMVKVDYTKPRVVHVIQLSAQCLPAKSRERAPLGHFLIAWTRTKRVSAR